MHKVTVMTDSVSCIPPELARQYSITVVPAAYIEFDGTSYIEGVTITPKEAYQLIRKDPDKFMTSAVTPGHILEAYRKLSTESTDIVFITISSALSAVYRSAILAADTFQEESPQTRIKVVDSKNVGGAQAMIALTAARAAAHGMDLEQVTDIAIKASAAIKGLMMLDTLRYIYRTGRMSRTAARIASLFNIKPINLVTPDGKIEMVERVRNRPDGFQKIVEVIRKEAGTDALYFTINHADAPEMAQKLAELLQKEFRCLNMGISEYSPVMGYGAGPGCLFVGFHPELNLLPSTS